MSAVDQFPLASSVTDGSEFSGIRQASGQPAANLLFTAAQIKAYLLDGGLLDGDDKQELIDAIQSNADGVASLRFSESFNLLPAGTSGVLYVVTSGAQIGTYLWNGNEYVGTGSGDSDQLNGSEIVTLLSALGDEDKLSYNSLKDLPESVAAGGWTIADLSSSGITGSIEYTGSAAPTFTESSGNYTLNVPAGVTWKRLRLSASNSGSATNSNTFTLSVTRADGKLDYPTLDVLDDGDGGKLLAPGEKGIRAQIASTSAGTVSVTIINIGAQTSAFTLIMP